MEIAAVTAFIKLLFHGKLPPLYWFKILGSVLADRTDKVLRESFALIGVSAYPADKALLFLWLWLWLDVLLIIRIGHCLPIRQEFSFGRSA